MARISAFLLAVREQSIDCLPQAWRKKIHSKVSPYRLEMAGDIGRLMRDGVQAGEIDLKGKRLDSAEKMLLTAHRVPLIIDLPTAWILRREVILPAAARENLRQLLTYELDRLTPFKAEQVYFDYRVRDADAQKLRVEIALVPSKQVQPLLELLHKEGIAIDALTFEGGNEFNLLPESHRPKVSLGRWFMRLAPGMIIVVLMAALLLVPLWRKQQIMQDLQHQERQIGKQAQVVMRLREQVEAEMQNLEAIRQTWNRVPPLVNILHALTRLLPKDTYLQQLDIKGNEITMRGLSSQASSLIALLEKAPGFKKARFLSPVTQQRGKEFFNLAVQVEPSLPVPKATTASKPVTGGAR